MSEKMTAAEIAEKWLHRYLSRRNMHELQSDIEAYAAQAVAEREAKNAKFPHPEWIGQDEATVAQLAEIIARTASGGEEGAQTWSRIAARNVLAVLRATSTTEKMG